MPRLHLLVLSSPWDILTGADRDFLTLAGALDPEKWRVTWAGSRACPAVVRPLLSEKIAPHIIGFDLPVWTPLVQEAAYQKRSPWLWAKILVRQAQKERRAARELENLMTADRPDLVVSNTAAILTGAFYARRAGLPHVWCLKECLDPQVFAARRFAGWIARNGDAIVVPSPACAAIFGNRATVVPDGCDVPKIEAGAKRATRDEILKRLELPANRPLVAQIGALVPWKGGQITAQAFVQLAHNAPDFSLVFLGGGSPDDQARLEAILAKAPVSWRGAARFARFESDDWSYVAAADIVVHPSILPDPLPNAVREAMILGKPVISVREGGPLEMISHAQTGLLVAPRAADALADALKHLLNAPDERARLGKAARNFAREFYDIKARKADFEAVFRAAIAGKTT